MRALGTNDQRRERARLGKRRRRAGDSGASEVAKHRQRVTGSTKNAETGTLVQAHGRVVDFQLTSFGATATNASEHAVAEFHVVR